MVERTAQLCRQLGAGEDREELVTLLARAVCERLAGELKEGTSPEDCGEAFPLGAALLTMELLEKADGGEGVSSLSVGEVSMRFADGQRLGRTARSLLAPFLKGPFAALEVEG